MGSSLSYLAVRGQGCPPLDMTGQGLEDLGQSRPGSRGTLVGGGENSAVLSSGVFSHFFKGLSLTMACVVSQLAQALTSLQLLGLRAGRGASLCTALQATLQLS